MRRRLLSLSAGLLLALPLLVCGCGFDNIYVNNYWAPAPFAGRDSDRLEKLEELRDLPRPRTADHVRHVLGIPDYVEEDAGLFYGYCIELSERQRTRYGPWDLEHHDEDALAHHVAVMQFDHDGILRRVRRTRVPDGSAPGEHFAVVVRRWKSGDKNATGDKRDAHPPPPTPKV